MDFQSKSVWIFMDFQSKSVWIFMDFQSKSVWVMDFLWNGYGFRILENMDYGMDMDLVLNQFGPTVCKYILFTRRTQG